MRLAKQIYIKRTTYILIGQLYIHGQCDITRRAWDGIIVSETAGLPRWLSGIPLLFLKGGVSYPNMAGNDEKLSCEEWSSL